LATFGYLFVLVFFAGMIVLCFIWGVWEYKKPKDPGPLFIDLDRTTDERSEERTRRVLKAADSEPSAHVGELAKSGMKLIPFASSRKALKAEWSEPIRWNAKIHETVRVRGDVRIPKGEVIPYNMIVEGNIASQDDVTFQGGLHIKGQAIIGARNRIKKSIVCHKELVLLEDVIVYNCIDCEGLVFIKKGVRVGVGVEGGGIASASTICMEKAEGPLKIYSKEGIRIVGFLKEVIPEDLKQIIEVKAT
jgi:hypothetical protein